MRVAFGCQSLHWDFVAANPNLATLTLVHGLAVALKHALGSWSGADEDFHRKLSETERTFFDGWPLPFLWWAKVNISKNSSYSSQVQDVDDALEARRALLKRRDAGWSIAATNTWFKKANLARSNCFPTLQDEADLLKTIEGHFGGPAKRRRLNGKQRPGLPSSSQASSKPWQPSFRVNRKSSQSQLQLRVALCRRAMLASPESPLGLTGVGAVAELLGLSPLEQRQEHAKLKQAPHVQLFLQTEMLRQVAGRVAEGSSNSIAKAALVGMEGRQMNVGTAVEWAIRMHIVVDVFSLEPIVLKMAEFMSLPVLLLFRGCCRDNYENGFLCRMLAGRCRELTFSHIVGARFAGPAGRKQRQGSQRDRVADDWLSFLSAISKDGVFRDQEMPFVRLGLTKMPLEFVRSNKCIHALQRMTSLKALCVPGLGWPDTTARRQFQRAVQHAGLDVQYR
ncbi:unnamed protein product [Polarella glacialis]|uniref:Uncharacterized protein n=1 Tax=Polarella glacialis TaxID=89957 RepID=A0A813DQK9_POLGL|nr:unnamed protein product [Polarella glacialis]